MIPNNVLSDRLKVKELKEGEVAVFALMNAAKREHGREEPSTPETYTLAGKHNVTDPFDKAVTRKTIANVIGTIPVTEKGKVKTDSNGSPIMIDEIKSIKFERGFFQVTAENNPTYQYLMRRKDNYSNTFRNQMGGKTTKPIYKLVEDKKELQDILQDKEIQYIAQKLIRESSLSDIKAIALKMNESPDKRLHVGSVGQGVHEDPSAIKLEMIQKAEQFPKLVISASSDQKARLKVQIYESIKFGIIRYEQGEYLLLEKDYVAIHKPAVDKDPIDSLLEYFMTDKEGGIKYRSMSDTLKKTLKG